MNLIVVLMLIASVYADRCYPFIGNNRQIAKAKVNPRLISVWDPEVNKFSDLEAMVNESQAFCSVKSSKHPQNQTFIVAVDNLRPYVMSLNNYTGVTGYIGDIWSILEEKFKFKSIFKKLNGTSTLEVMHGYAHALLVTTSMFSYTSSYYTYSMGLTSNSYSLFVPVTPASTSMWWYVEIFSDDLWLTLFIFTFCLILLITGFYALKKRFIRNHIELNDEFKHVSFNLLYVVAGICGQGHAKMPLSWSLRLLSISFLIMGMLLSNEFNSVLTSYLTHKSTVIPVTQIRGLDQQSYYSICIRNRTVAYTLFTYKDYYTQLRRRWIPIINKNCPDMWNDDDIVSKLCEPNLLFLEARDVFIPLYNKVKHKCRYVDVGQRYSTVVITFLHARWSRYRRILDTYIVRLRAGGILKYLENKWIRNRIEEINDSGQFIPVEYAHIHFAFSGLATMILISIALCVLENVWYRLMNSEFENSSSKIKDRNYAKNNRRNVFYIRKKNAMLRFRLQKLKNEMKNHYLYRDVTEIKNFRSRR